MLQAQWMPDDPVYLQAAGKYYSIGLVLETFRQASMLMTHQARGVPLGQQFVMRRISARVDPAALLVVQGGCTPTVAMRLELDRQQGERRRIKWELSLHLDSRQIGVGHGDLTALPREEYAALRTSAVPARSVSEGREVPPAVVGKNVPEDVVVTAARGPLRHRLRVPLDHPTYFDHPLDHVPGMLVIEAACQAVLAVVTPGSGGGPVVACEADAQFSRFVEFWPPCDLVTEPFGTDAGSVSLRQADQECAAVVVGLGRP